MTHVGSLAGRIAITLMVLVLRWMSSCAPDAQGPAPSAAPSASSEQGQPAHPPCEGQARQEEASLASVADPA